MARTGLFSLACAIAVVLCVRGALGLSEAERLEEFARRGHQWPATWHPQTEGWRHLMDRRARQLEANPNNQEKWDGYISFMGSALLTPNFTRLGFEKTRAPPELHRELLRELSAKIGSAGGGGASQLNPSLQDSAVAENYGRQQAPLSPEERPKHRIGVIRGEDRPTFYHNTPLTRKVLRELQPMHEDWSRQSLVPVISYGFRFYHNESQLLMHVDKMYDHVISSIFHIDHSVDSEPWPLFIEGFDGNTYSVTLEPGEMLFYESAKCMHGRPRSFRGSWYTSVFTHYRPTDWGLTNQDSIFAIPANWARQAPRDPGLPELRLIGTGFYEPCAEDLENWCTKPLEIGRHAYHDAQGVHLDAAAAPNGGAKEDGPGNPGLLHAELARAKTAHRRSMQERRDAELRGHDRLVPSYSEHHNNLQQQGLSENQQGWLVFVGLLVLVALATRMTRSAAEKKGV